MKNVVATVAALLLLASCFTVPSQNAYLLPGFAEHGLTVVSTSPQSGVSQAELVLTGTRDVELAATLTTRTDLAVVHPDAAQVTREGGIWRILAIFPETGPYQLTLAARPAGATGDTWEAVAFWNFDAVVDAATAAERNAAPLDFGLKVARATPQSDVADAELMLTTDQDIELLAGLADGTGTYVSGGADVIRTAEGWRVVAIFPASGSYQLYLSAKAASDTANVYRQVASWTYRAVVPDGDTGVTLKPRFRLYGLEVVSATPQDGVADGEIVLAGEQDLTLYYNISPASKESNTITSLSAAGERRWVLPVDLDSDGDWMVKLWGRRPDEGNTIHELGVWKYRAVVGQGDLIYSRFGRYGLRVVTGPAATAGAETQLLVAGDRDVRLQAILKNRSTGTEQTLPVLRETTPGSAWRVPVVFPTTGAWELSLKGKLSSDPGYTTYRLGRWMLSATVPPGDLQYAALQRLGVRVVSRSPSTGSVSEAEIVLSVPEAVYVDALIIDRATGLETGETLSADTEGGQRILVPFPATGEYDVVLTATQEGSYGVTERLARYAYRAAVDPSLKTYVYSRGGSFLRIRLSEIGPAQEDVPAVGWSGHAPASQGVLAGDLEVRLNTIPLRLPRGSTILLDESAGVLRQFLYTLPAPLVLRAGDVQVSVPRSSRLLFTWYEDALLEPAGAATLTVGPTVLSIQELVVFHEGAKTAWISAVLAGDTVINLGGGANTWPAGSTVQVDEPYRWIGSIQVPKDFTVLSRGVSTAVKAWQAVTFDDKGNVTGAVSMEK